MKTLTDGELLQALKNAPEPVRDFAVSKTLASIYDGIQKKHKLSDVEMVAISEIANRTLLGIEPESAVETNIHQTLPELSHATTAELAADIAARIIKEGKRRLEERVLEPSLFLEALDYVPNRDPEYVRLDNLGEDDPEWQAIEKAEQEQAALEHKEFEEKYAAEQAKPKPREIEEKNADDEAFLEEDGEIPSRFEEEDAAIEKEFSDRETALGEAPAPSGTAVTATVGGDPTLIERSEPEETPPLAAPAAPIAAKKLAASGTAQKEETETELNAPESTPAPARTREIYKSPDPYREPLD